MINWLLIENGKIVAREPKDSEVLPSDYSGTFDTVTIDPSGLFKVGEQYTIEQWEVYNIPEAERLLTSKDLAQGKLQAEFDKQVSMLSTAMPHEMTSWRKQEEQARAWNADNAVATPIIDAILATRNLGETKQQFVDIVIRNADAYESQYGAMLGKFHKLSKAILDASTIVVVESISW